MPGRCPTGPSTIVLQAWLPAPHVPHQSLEKQLSKLFFLKKPKLFPYLGEGQAILVLIFILYFKVVKCFALRWSLWERLDTLDVAGREEAVVPIELPMVPVIIHLPPQYDDVPLVKLEVTGLFSLIRVESFAIGKLRNTLGKQNTQHL